MGSQIVAYDNFIRADSASALGVALDGNSWTSSIPSAGTAGTWSITKNTAQVTGASTSQQFNRLGPSTTYTDVEVTSTYQSPTMTTSGNWMGLFARYDGVATTAKYYTCLSEGTNIGIYNAASTVIGTAAAKTYALSTYYRLRFNLTGTTLKVRIWAASAAEPATWDVTVTDATYASGSCGLFVWSNVAGDVAQFFSYSARDLTANSGSVISRIQANETFSSTNAVTGTVDTGVQLGSLLVAKIIQDGSTGAISGPTGWTQAVSKTDATSHFNVTLWYLLVGAGQVGQSSWTWTGSGTTNTVALIVEWNSNTGWAASPLDVTASNTHSTTSTSVGSGSTATTAQASELWVAATAYKAGTQQQKTITAGWTYGLQYVNSTTDVFQETYNIPTATGAASCTYTLGTAELNTGAIATFKTNASASTTWFDTNYGFSKSITIAHGKVGDTFGAPVVNMPVLISETDVNLKVTGSGGNVTNSSGFDIIFVWGDNATQLDHEIDSYTGSTGKVEMWVQAPCVSSQQDTVIYMYYGNSAITTSQENVNGTWDSNYDVVYHMGSTSTISTTDSTTNAKTLTATGTPTATTGIINGATTFNGSSQYMQSSANSAISGTANRTVSMWANNVTTVTQGFTGIGVNTAGEMFGTLVLNARWLIWGYASGHDNDTGVTATTNTWHYHCLERDTAGNFYWYMDGKMLWWGLNTTDTTGVSVYDVGQCHDGTTHYYMNGKLDEVRWSTVCRTTDQIFSEYNNQNSPSTFLTFGTQQVGSTTIFMSGTDTLTCSDSGSDALAYSATENVTASNLAGATVVANGTDSLILADSYGVADAAFATDALTATETSTYAHTLTSTDQLTLADAATETLAYTALSDLAGTVSDTIAPTDVFAPTEQLTETELLTESIALTFTADTGTVSDAFGSTKLFSVSEVAGTVSDTWQGVDGYVPTDSLATSETAAYSETLNQTDSVTASESSSDTLAYSVTELAGTAADTWHGIDTYVPTDSLATAETTAEAIAVSFTDQLTCTDSGTFSTNGTTFISGTDQLTCSESAAYALALSQTDTGVVAETTGETVAVSFTEVAGTVADAWAGATGFVPTDSLATSETGQEGLALSLVDIALSPTDSGTFTGNGTTFISGTDQLTVGDAASFALVESIVDTGAISDTFITAEALAASDSLTTSDAFARTDIFVPVDQLTSNEAALFALAESIGDSGAVADALTAAPALAASDGLTASDSFTKTENFVPVDQVIVIETVVSALSVNAPVDTAPLTDFGVWTDVFVPADHLTPLDAYSSALTFTRVETLTAADILIDTLAYTASEGTGPLSDTLTSNAFSNLAFMQGTDQLNFSDSIFVGLNETFPADTLIEIDSITSSVFVHANVLGVLRSGQVIGILRGGTVIGIIRGGNVEGVLE